MMPVATPTSSRPKIQLLPLLYRASATLHCHHSHFQPGSAVGVHRLKGWPTRKMAS